MWMRGVLSVVWLIMTFFAFALWDCASSIVGDPLALCPSVTSLGIEEPVTVSRVIVGVSLVGLVAAWHPVLRWRRRQRRNEPERALLENIGRLPEPYVGIKESNEISPDAIDELRRAIEVVETAFATDSTASRSTTAEWIRLLVEANRMHNVGLLPTADFKEMNTRLLAAVTAPTSRGASA